MLASSLYMHVWEKFDQSREGIERRLMLDKNRGVERRDRSRPGGRGHIENVPGHMPRTHQHP